MVGQGGVELVQQIPVGGVELHPIETGFLRPAGGLGKGFHHRLDFPHCHSPREGRPRLGTGRLHSAGAHRLHACVLGIGRAPRVADLRHGLHPVVVDSIRQPPQAGNVLLPGDGELTAVGLALLAHKGVLGNHQAQVPALGFFLIVFHQAIADGPIWVGLSRGHGRHDQPAGQIHPADCNRLC